MKKFLLLLSLLLCSCSPDIIIPSDADVALMKRFETTFYHKKNCKGHTLEWGKEDFNIDGHDMWFIYCMDGLDVVKPFILHSPDCKKCNGGETSTEHTVPNQTENNDWGW